MNKTAKVVIWIVIAVVVVVGGYFLLNNQKPTSNEPIKIGWIGPLTGDAASIGQNEQAAVEVAVDEVNKAGGVNGQPIQVIYEDGQCAGTAASTAANKLINVDKVPVILGGTCSGETMAFTSVAEQSKTVVLSPCSSNPAITNAGDYIFRDYPSDNYQGTFAANYIFNTLGKKKVAVLYIQNDYAVGIRGVFVDAFKKLGGTIVADESAAASATDFRAQLTKIKAANPDLVYSLGMADEATVSIKQARGLGINVPFFGGDAWGDAKIWSGLGQAGEGSMYTSLSTPLTDTFKAAVKAKAGTDVTDCSAEAYDGLKILAQVMGKVGTNSEAIKNQLYKTVYNGGVSASKIQFDSNGDLIGANYNVEVVHNGVAAPVK